MFKIMYIGFPERGAGFCSIAQKDNFYRLAGTYTELVTGKKITIICTSCDISDCINFAWEHNFRLIGAM